MAKIKYDFAKLGTIEADVLDVLAREKIVSWAILDGYIIVGCRGTNKTALKKILKEELE